MDNPPVYPTDAQHGCLSAECHSCQNCFS
jgi:hypothetical protein